LARWIERQEQLSLLGTFNVLRELTATALNENIIQLMEYNAKARLAATTMTSRLHSISNGEKDARLRTEKSLKEEGRKEQRRQPTGAIREGGKPQ
jgi:hypothetical protein